VHRTFREYHPVPLLVATILPVEAVTIPLPVAVVDHVLLPEAEVADRGLVVAIDKIV
jgi:hypothetical protein